jgi:hypothetical protein
LAGAGPQALATREQEERGGGGGRQPLGPLAAPSNAARTLGGLTSGGFENLDFLGNVGHTFEVRRENRRHLQQGSQELLGQVRLFTFESHIRAFGSPWGFRHENVYYLSSEGRAMELQAAAPRCRPAIF